MREGSTAVRGVRRSLPPPALLASTPVVLSCGGDVPPPAQDGPARVRIGPRGWKTGFRGGAVASREESSSSKRPNPPAAPSAVLPERGAGGSSSVLHQPEYAGFSRQTPSDPRFQCPFQPRRRCGIGTTLSVLQTPPGRAGLSSCFCLPIRDQDPDPRRDSRRCPCLFRRDPHRFLHVPAGRENPVGKRVGPSNRAPPLFPDRLSRGAL